MDTALSYHGIIPEAVTTILSVTTKRSKNFNTSLGYFIYKYASKSYFPIGVSRFESGKNEAFLMATPEKALCDKIVFSKNLNLRSVKAVKDFLFEDLRCDEEEIAQLNINIIQNCSGVSKKQRTLSLLVNLIKKL